MMTEPSDKDITRALAKLAGYEVADRRSPEPSFAWVYKTGLQKQGKRPVHFSPLTDWRDLGPLIEKYYVSINPRFDMMPMEWEAAKGEYFGYDRSLMRAACLALYQMEQEQ